MVGALRLELRTFGLKVRYSSQLSYTPTSFRVLLRFRFIIISLGRGGLIDIASAFTRQLVILVENIGNDPIHRHCKCQVRPIRIPH